MSVRTVYARKRCAQHLEDSRGLVRGEEVEGVVEEREGAEVEGAGDKEGRRLQVCSTTYLRTEY
jgi:hypothetical protein